MNNHQTTLAIQGMRDASATCAVTLEQALTQLDGVIAAHVNYATERATVLYTPTQTSLMKIVRVVQDRGFQVPLERIALNIENLIYVSSTQTLMRALSVEENIVHIQIDQGKQQIVLEMLADQVDLERIKRTLAKFGLRVVEQPVPSLARSFVVRTVLMIALAMLAILSAVAHAGWIQLGILHIPFTVMVLTMLIIYGLGWRYFLFAYEACLQDGFDPTLLFPLVVSALMFVGLVVAIVAPVTWLTDSGFVLAILLTVGWFVARSFALLNWSLDPKIVQSFFAGLVAFFVLVGIYLGILTGLQSPAHAFEQLADDRFWVGLVATGFGIQIGLYTYLRLNVQAAKLAGATAMTGVSTGTSALGMLACCTHHISEIAPLVALTGASSLASTISFFNAWKYALIILGIAMNVLGIIVTARTIRTLKAQLKTMITPTLEAQAAPGCH